jgi:excisionase family DNA binding protein
MKMAESACSAEAESVMGKSNGRENGKEKGCCPEEGSAAEMMLAALERLLREISLDKELLGIEQAAALMRCSVDTVRRIASEELPIYRVGRENLYLREEILRYVRSRAVTSASVDELLDDVLSGLEAEIQGVVGSEPVVVRERSSRRTL